jgi:hypothetical protein
LQDELNTEGVDVRIVGVNETGHESNSDLMCDQRDLPWLEEADTGVWDAWEVEYRDVIVLDADNFVVDAFNLSSRDLNDEANYSALADLLRATAP